jgi:hypothetical protein
MRESTSPASFEGEARWYLDWFTHGQLDATEFADDFGAAFAARAAPARWVLSGVNDSARARASDKRVTERVSARRVECMAKNFLGGGRVTT